VDGSDGAVLPFVVDGFYVVLPSVASWWPDDGFDSEVETDPYPVRERVVGMSRFRERVIDRHSKGYRQFRPCVFDEERDRCEDGTVEVLARRNTVGSDICDLDRLETDATLEIPVLDPIGLLPYPGDRHIRERKMHLG